MLIRLDEGREGWVEGRREGPTARVMARSTHNGTVWVGRKVQIPYCLLYIVVSHKIDVSLILPLFWTGNPTISWYTFYMSFRLLRPGLDTYLQLEIVLGLTGIRRASDRWAGSPRIDPLVTTKFLLDIGTFIILVRRIGVK